MRSTSYFTAALLFLLSASAFAIPEEPSPQTPSPGLQIARRVAAIENDKDLPSRAVWLGKKAALNSRLAFEAQGLHKSKKKHPN